MNPRVNIGFKANGVHNLSPKEGYELSRKGASIVRIMHMPD